MGKILVIGNSGSSIQQFSQSLSKKGFSLQTAKTIKQALASLQKPDITLLVIDSSFKDSGGDLKKLTAAIPRLVIVNEGESNTAGTWLKHINAQQISAACSFSSFWQAASRLIRIKNLEDENKTYKTMLKGVSKELDFFDHVTESLCSGATFQQCINNIIEKARAVVGAETWSLLIPTKDPVFDFISLRSTKKIQRITFKDGTGIAGLTIDTGKPYIVQDVKKDKRYKRSVDGFDNIMIASLICVPLEIKGRIVGAVRLINKKDTTPFSDGDLKVITKAAELAGIAIERTYMNQKIKNDDLTNLYNVRYLHQALEMEIERSRRYETCFSVIFMDLDNFKKVNDRHGHLTGSRILIEIAGLILDNLRKIDVVTRYGGDEFVIIMPQACLKSGFMVAERLRKAVEKRSFLKDQGHMIKLTASFGVATYPDNAKSKDELIKMADAAMYHGKFSTKNIVYTAKTV